MFILMHKQKGLYSFGKTACQQLILKPTHLTEVKPSCIDLTFASQSNLIEVSNHL